MNIFNCRSPFIIEVTGDPDQTATKIELYIWKVGETAPATPTKVLEKTKYSDTQYTNYYNISPFVYDVINTIIETDFAYNVGILTYYKIDADWILADEREYVSVNGYNSYGTSTTYSYGTNCAILRGSYAPGIPKIDYFYDTDIFGSFNPTIDLIFDFSTTSSDFLIQYYTTSFDVDHYEVQNDYINYTNDGLINKHRVSMIVAPTVGDIVSTEFKIFEDDGESVNLLFEALLTPICEPKYKPLILKYVNSVGGLQEITLFKNSTKTIDVKGSDYNTNTFTAGYPNYDTSLGQKRIFNKNGGTTIKCNTGWISEDKNLDIQDIMLSENLFLTSLDTTINNAVTLKNTSQLMKTHLNEKVINYELEFELANKLINNVV